jgi:hypothetical protein
LHSISYDNVMRIVEAADVSRGPLELLQRAGAIAGVSVQHRRKVAGVRVAFKKPRGITLAHDLDRPRGQPRHVDRDAHALIRFQPAHEQKAML